MIQQWLRGCLTIALVMVLARPALSEDPPKEPTYRGKTLNQWIEASNNLTEIDQLVLAILNLKESAGKPKVRQLILNLRSEHTVIRQKSAAALAILSDHTSSAMPELTRLLRTDKVPKVRATACYAIGLINEPRKDTLPALLQALKDKDSHCRSTAAWALDIILANFTPPVTVALTRAIKDRSPSVRYTAARAIAKRDPKAKIAVPVLIEALKKKAGSEIMRMEIIYLLGAMGGLAVDAIPVLQEIVKEGDRYLDRPARLLGDYPLLRDPAKSAIKKIKKAISSDEEPRQFRCIRFVLL